MGQQPLEQVAWSDGRSLRDGIGQLFQEHSTDLLAWFQSRTFSGQVAADLCAETFAVALEQAARFDPSRGTSGAWLWGIARNLLRRYHRDAAVDARARQRLAIRSQVVAEDDLDLIEQRFDAAAMLDDGRAALDDLSPKVAAAVRCRVLDQQPYEVVARVCDCTEATARVRVSRGLSTLLERARAFEAEGEQP